MPLDHCTNSLNLNDVCSEADDHEQYQKLTESESSVRYGREMFMQQWPIRA